MNIVSVLRKDHQKVKDLLKKIEKTTLSRQRQKLFTELVKNLTPHEDFEEKKFYPMLIQAKKQKTKVMESYEEHHVADFIISELKKTPINSDIWKAKFSVLKENLQHHIREEEAELFPYANKKISKLELKQIAERYLSEKQKLGLE
jgi:hemerythrin-like domain-containing protein